MKLGRRVSVPLARRINTKENDWIDLFIHRITINLGQIQ